MTDLSPDYYARPLGITCLHGVLVDEEDCEECADYVYNLGGHDMTEEF
jgi:hypothetical protein